MSFMKILTCLLIGSLLLTSCSLFGTPNPQGTVQADVAATVASNVDLQSTAQVAVQSTLALIPTLTPQPTPTPSLELLSYDEEQLASKAVDAITQVTISLQECYTTTLRAVSNSVLTSSQASSISSGIDSAKNDLDQTGGFLAAYAQVYGDLSPDTLSQLGALNFEIVQMAQTVYDLQGILDQTTAIFQQSQEPDKVAVYQLKYAAQAASFRASQGQQAFQVYSSQLGEKLALRQQAILSSAPDEIPLDLNATIQKGFNYLDAVIAALDDKQLTLNELTHIAQLGAGFSAGVRQFGTPDLQRLSDQVSGPDGITADLAAGRITQAKASLGSLEAGLGPRP